MHLKKISIDNFRGLEHVDAEFDSLVNVIIGPNAVGKTTVLEAIRLAKGLLAPRTQNESSQVLQSLGALSPHMPQRLFPAALTSRVNTPISIKCRYGLEQSEVDQAKQLAPQLTAALAQQSAGLSFAPPNQAMAFLSSPHGVQAMAVAAAKVDPEIASLTQRKSLDLNLTIDPRTGRINSDTTLHQTILAALEQALEPSKTYFSYFPADRAMPVGEQPVQLGVADTSAQLESFNSQPQLKYNRLKNTIFNAIIMATKGREDLGGQFELIFDRILKGRGLGDIGINDIGMLSIPIIDKDSGTQFQIDGLSSGEKGLILTFLLIAVSMERNGIILLDEPELHLNPAVSRELLQFFVDEYASKRNIQAIICSHSAEILAGTFERPSCSLFHLRDSKSLAKVRIHDREEIRDALRRLGSSESEALLYKGTVSVEGIHDVEILQVGFDDIFRRYKIRHSGGRVEIETAIQELQKAEKRGEEIGRHYFVFDHDRKPTHLKNSDNVRLAQLDRYCLENYLLDVDILTDLTRNKEFSAKPKSNTTEMRDVMKELAFAQLDELVYRERFKELGLEQIRFDMDIMRESSIDVVSDELLTQLHANKALLEKVEGPNFKSEFETWCNGRREQLRAIWDEKWRELCDGKKLFEELRSNGHVKGDLLRLKKAVMEQMRAKKPESYILLDNFLRDLLILK